MTDITTRTEQPFLPRNESIAVIEFKPTREPDGTNALEPKLLKAALEQIWCEGGCRWYNHKARWAVCLPRKWYVVLRIGKWLICGKKGTKIGTRRTKIRKRTRRHIVHTNHIGN